MTTGAAEIPDDAAAPACSRWRWGLVLRLTAVALLLALALAIGGEPLVQAPPPPDARSTALARSVVRQVAGDENFAGKRQVIVLRQAELDGLSALVSQVIAPTRVEAQLVAPPRGSDAPPVLVARISHGLPLGAWLNIEARVESVDQGRSLPLVRARIGHLPVPAWLTRMAMTHGWSLVEADSPQARSLEETLPLVHIGRREARIVLIHPGRSAALAGLARLGGTSADPRWVARAYCALTPHADADLAAIVRRAWRVPRPQELAAVEQNRALVLAVAMRTVPEYRDRLAGAAFPMIARCTSPDQPVTLAGRNDLAKHWAMSAALEVSLGGSIAQSLGVFKELSDSLEGGSGFSFVDLTADRSGERFARAATDPQLARFVQTRLAAVTQDQLLAREALDKPEGLDAALFERTYSNIDSPEYAAALAAIDRLLDNIGVPKP